MDQLLEALTLERIKLHLGISNDDVTYDDQIKRIKDTVIPLIIEDTFNKQELSKLTANQRERAVYALSLIAASEALFPIVLGGAIGVVGGLNATGRGESIRVGPISIAEGSGSATVSAGSNLQKRAREMRKIAEEILEDLRILSRATMLEWGVV